MPLVLEPIYRSALSHRSGAVRLKLLWLKVSSLVRFRIFLLIIWVYLSLSQEAYHGPATTDS
uniref:Uncharacterized protein n=1 Tax=Arundo donax TaxID=35708 RepID=A0A0A9ATQ9_ARUDO